VPRTVSGYRPATMAFLKSPMETRLAKARQLLAEAGFGPANPLTLTYTHSNVLEMRRVAIAIAAMWKRIGVDCRLNGTEGKVMFADLRQGNYEAAYAGWSADYDDAASFLYLLQSSSVSSNYSRYHNAAYDDLLAKAAASADRKQRADLLREAETLALADQPILPLLVGTSRTLVARRVHGWAPNPMDVALSRYLSVDPVESK
jgi:oligopeptide transport system substrate-binding protein